MDQDISLTPSRDAKTLARKSWIAYLGPLLMLALLLALTAAATVYAGPIALGLLLIGGAFIAYQILTLRSHHLYMDDIGVWHARGILPWSKGVSGVKWRDLDEAVFMQGFGSWLLRSYTIRVAHRFTKDSEIVLTQMADGPEAVMTMNAAHQELVRQGKLS